MSDVGISDLQYHVPGAPVGLDAIFEGAEVPLAQSPLLRPPEHRHHVDRDVTAADLVMAAVEPMLARRGSSPAR